MSNVRVRSMEGRVRFAHVFTPTDNFNRDGKEKTITLCIPKTANLAVFEKARMKAAKDEFNGKVPPALVKITGGQKPILKDGDEYYETREEEKKPMYESHKGCWILAVACKPTANLRILDEVGNDMADPAELYDGCYAEVLINFSCYMSKSRTGYVGGPILSRELLVVKKTRDGEPIEAGDAAPLTDEELKKYFGGAASQADTVDDL